MIDFHMHSDYSFDGKSSMLDMAKAAKKQGIDYLCFTDHVDIGHKVLGFARFPNNYDIEEELETVRKKVNADISLGLEIGDNMKKRDVITGTLKYWKLDYVLLSLHLVDGVDCYDKRYFQNRTREKSYRLYLETMLESVKNFPDYDGCAHIGYCGRYSPYLPEETRPLRYSDAPDVVDEILKTLIERDKALEINGSGLLKGMETLPEIGILRRYKELGGENIITGGDEHRAEDAGRSIRQCYELADSLGFKYICRYKNREKIMTKLELR
jgi:histidinol-phosphatase (PHP family)